MNIDDRKRQGASDIWARAFDTFHVSLADAGLPFLNRWHTSSSKCSDECVLIADMLWGISNSLTTKSADVFAEKVRQLIASRSERDFLARVAEFEVCGLLVPIVSPIAFEPAVPVANNSAQKPPSADYSLNLPGGEVFVEATSIDLRGTELDDDALLPKLYRKIYRKRYQASRDRVYIIAVRIIGGTSAFAAVRDLIVRRILPNPRFRRIGGLLTIAPNPDSFGQYFAAWLPNVDSLAPPTEATTDLFTGARCYHLERVEHMNCSPHELAEFRESVDRDWLNDRQIATPVDLIAGPLAGKRILLSPTQVGDHQISYCWEFEGSIMNRSNIEWKMPPHGPINVVYKRQHDTLYEFDSYRVYIDHERPDAPGTAYLPNLDFGASSTDD